MNRRLTVLLPIAALGWCAAISACLAPPLPLPPPQEPSVQKQQQLTQLLSSNSTLPSVTSVNRQSINTSATLQQQQAASQNHIQASGAMGQNVVAGLNSMAGNVKSPLANSLGSPPGVSKGMPVTSFNSDALSSGTLVTGALTNSSISMPNMSMNTNG